MSEIECLLIDRCGIGVMPLKKTKLTGPASSNQSRSDQAGREEGDHRLGGCPCDEGHGGRDKEKRE